VSSQQIQHGMGACRAWYVSRVGSGTVRVSLGQKQSRVLQRGVGMVWQGQQNQKKNEHEINQKIRKWNKNGVTNPARKLDQNIEYR